MHDAGLNKIYTLNLYNELHILVILKTSLTVKYFETDAK